jgi:hypothetical protein
MPHAEPDAPSTEPTDQSKDVPSQRGTSSGEIGQNPVEIIGKKIVPPGDKPASDPLR